MKKLVAIIVGGTGQFGIITSNLLLKKNYKVVVTTRNIKKKNYLIKIKISMWSNLIFITKKVSKNY